MITPSQISTPKEEKPSKLEGIKENSNFLREPLATQLLEDTNHFTEEAVQILKFHGSYQQHNRDNIVKGQEKDYQMMLRTRNPGGFIPPQLFLTLNSLSHDYGNGTLRVTTRQGFQLHGILKKNLKTVISSIIKSMGSTLGACGDLNRNVMSPPAPYKNRPEYEYAKDYANKIADLLAPQTGAYYEIWLDGEKVISAEEAPEVKAARQLNINDTIFPNSEEPIYGTHYMPRKFKCAVTVPGDNSIDLYTQDVSLVVITNEAGELEGFNVLAGGGLGRTHRKEDTFPCLAQEIGYVTKEDIFDLVKAIVATQRDYGDRSKRRHARMKYLLHDWGIEKFKAKLVEYFGKSIAPFRPLPEWKYLDFLGWHEQGDGKLFLGISVENGRVKDEDSFQLKTALRKIVQLFKLPMLLTANHNIILYEIEPRQQQAIEQIFTQHGISKEKDIDPLVRYSMACPAFPTCGLAMTESERALPGILGQIRLLLDKVGLGQEHPVIRMTGCPNGCARPYMAELGFVGSAPDAYQIWLGGSPNQTRLAKPYIDKLHINNLEAELERIFIYFKQQRQPDESFGDFCNRVGIEAIRQFVTNYQSSFSMNTDINNSGFTSINSENNIPVVTDGNETTSETQPQEEAVSTSLENNQEMTPINPPVTSPANVDNSTLVTPSTTVSQTTTTTPLTTTEIQPLNTPQTQKTPVFTSDDNTTTPAPATLGQPVSQPVAPTQPATLGQPVSQPVAPTQPATLGQPVSQPVAPTQPATL
ncbi:sulfite reductase, ferredoxin dependent, partial [Dapis sp. BLCC M126]|uniref:sulfite reductase, ferredoxin dependent n=1 Tax=Dapis sp. BLCC M126 TaxID=3400189 RepID=UPI003CF4C0B6